MSDDDPISRLVQMYKQALLATRLYQALLGIDRSAGIPHPEQEKIRQRLEPQLEAEFRVYRQSLRDGYSPKDSLERLLASFPTEK